MEKYDDLIKRLGTGEQNKISRQNLAVLLGLPDRKMREHIEFAQLDGVPIVNLSNGYFLAESKDELRQYTRRELHRRTAIENKCKALNYTNWFDRGDL